MRRFSSAGQAALCVLLLGLTTVPVPPGAASSPPAGETRDTGERFFSPLGQRELRVLVDGATGLKSLEDSAGRRWSSVEDAVREEEQTLPPVRRTVHPGLWPLLDDPARAGDPVRVVLVLRSQPLRDASLLLREKAAPAIRQRIARIRAVLNGIAPLRAEDPERLLQLGHRMEEEARLLGPDAREELRRLRAETQSLLRDLRGEILADAREGCDLAQAPVLERLARIPDARVLARIRVLNAVVAEVPAGSLAALAESLPGLARILPHGVRRPGLNTSVATLGATTWSGAGYDGSSTTKVAIMDTGIDANHPAFFAGGNSIISNSAVFLAVGSQDPSFQDNASSTDDIFGHGSHVGGIVMSQDSTYKGVAPGGALMNAKCGYNSSQGGNLQDGDIMSAGDWAADNGADAVNASFGGDDVTDGSSGLSLFFDALVDGLGIAAAVAAGNSGAGSGTVGVPGDAFNVITVGSIADANTTTRSDDAISSFSSRGPLDDGRRKPDLAAPGSSITSCNYRWEGGNADFVAYDGTSMATPHIAGTCAVLLDYAASWRPEGLKALLLSTTRNLSSSPALPNNNLGWGAADLSAAYASRATIKEGTLTSSGRDFAFVRMPNLASGKRATLCWNRDVAWNNASTPVTYRPAVDLDLYVYEESDGSLKGSSISGINTVEQVALSSTSTFPLLKIKRAGGFPSGQSSVSFAVASESTGTVPPEPAPPSLQCALDAGPALVKPGDTFTVTATLTVNGDLPAFAPTVTLTLPDGYSLVSGTDTVILQGIAAGGSRAASWSVTAGGLTGEKTLSATGSTDSYGETFTSPAGTDDQILDATGPTGAVVVQGGAVAVPSSSVSVAVYAADDRTGVDSMRVRNALASWGDWQPFVQTFPWTLASGEGLRTVDVQVRDGAGNESGVLSGSIFVDPTAPSGSFVLSGDVSYLLPWESLTADTTSDDGAYGSGIKAVHVRWIKDGVPSAWTAWTPLDGDPVVPLARPAVDHDVRAEAQFRDAAGNVSGSAFDGIYLVEPDPPSLTAAKSFSGAMAPGGDVDAFVLGAVSGDLVTVKIKSKPVRKGADFRVDADLVDPAGGRVVAGRYPVDAKRAGIAKFPIAITGDHWILIRAGGADAAEGGTYVLEVKRSVAKGNRGLGTGGDPVGGFVEIPFPGVAGSIVTGSIRGLFTGDPDVRRPDDSTGAVVTLPGSGGSRKIPGLVLTGGSGTYVLRIPAAGPVAVDLKFRAPQRLKLIEGAE